MFHDLGKNLTIYYFPEEYAEIKILMTENGNDIQSAARSVLGISLDELGVAVARAWKFPENIAYCMRGLPSGAVEKPKSVLDYVRHFSVFANELCGLAGSGLPENRGEPLSRLVQRFEQSIDISETEVLTLFRSEIEGLQKYTAILDIDPDQSPFVQSLLEFIGTDDGPDVTKVCENQPPQTSESGDVENLPFKDGVKETKGSDRIKQSHSISNPHFSALPMGIWQRFLKLVHK
jgi:hypothetical protein